MQGKQRRIALYATGALGILAVVAVSVFLGSRSGNQTASSIPPAILGPTTIPTTVPSWSVQPNSVEPGESIQEAIERTPPGGEIILAPGTHRAQTLTPKSNQTILGAPGSVLSGAVLLSEWRSDGGNWVADTPRLSSEIFDSVPTRVCVDEAADDSLSNPGTCRTPYVLFIDDVWIPWATDHERLTEGYALLDVAKSQVIIGLDPTGRKIEFAVTDFAFKPGSAEGVILRDLTIEKYATPLQRATVTTGDGWTFEDGVIRSNHAIGIRLDSNSILSRSEIYGNGHNGVGTRPGAQSAQVLANEIYGNGLGGVDPLWGAGGSKFVESVGLVVRGNHVHDNHGPGLWTDGGNVGVLYEDNVVERNAGAGIMHELSHDAIIQNNEITGNGYQFNLGGIYVANSNNVEIYGNTLTNNNVGVLARQQDRDVELEDLSVYDNTIIKTTGEGYAAGLIETVGDSSFFTTRNNRFWGNHYLIGDQYDKPFQWEGSQRTKDEWQDYGNDTDGTWTTPS